jgi:hypothetical protein
MKFAKQRFQDASYCPFCGTQALERDRYGETLENPRYKNEFICSACGWGVQIMPSTRHQHAASLHRQHREQRPPDDSNKPVKLKPLDIELYALQKYAERLEIPGQIERCKNGRTFVLRDSAGRAHVSTGYEKMMTLLRGYQIARFDLAPQ